MDTCTWLPWNICTLNIATSLAIIHATVVKCVVPPYIIQYANLADPAPCAVKGVIWKIWACMLVHVCLTIRDYRHLCRDKRLVHGLVTLGVREQFHLHLCIPIIYTHVHPCILTYNMYINLHSCTSMYINIHPARYTHVHLCTHMYVHPWKLMYTHLHPCAHMYIMDTHVYSISLMYTNI